MRNRLHYPGIAYLVFQCVKRSIVTLPLKSLFGAWSVAVNVVADPGVIVRGGFGLRDCRVNPPEKPRVVESTL
jgi:hypothetical protein